jgi:hypothetical protein
LEPIDFRLRESVNGGCAEGRVLFLAGRSIQQRLLQLFAEPLDITAGLNFVILPFIIEVVVIFY